MQRTCPTDRQSIRERDIKPSSLLVRRILDKLTVVCPNNAYCDLTIGRSQLEVHLKYHCAGSYVSCPREEAGCEYMGPRCQLEEHLWSCSYGKYVDRKSESSYMNNDIVSLCSAEEPLCYCGQPWVSFNCPD